ncbi:hypothetical protein LPB85_12840 [Chryseobacterium sp. LC2016-27]|uniref:hypothetical protein n=1 Tax=Chryseobacterium sp. LC2016-27 TaxID=2897326 RepID=UPI001E41073E|nr:hypothetical protein [Chryseobacterium sp. LC2016-27]MCD0456324.1 hypothetical protein [Chryseobacterium sp. LC2016-27]
MILYIYPNAVDPTEQQVLSLRTRIIDSLSEATTWTKLDRTFLVGNVPLPLFMHIREQYQNEPFYFRFNDDSVILKFENNNDENSKSMVIGMLTYYFRYNLSDHIRKIELR